MKKLSHIDKGMLFGIFAMIVIIFVGLLISCRTFQSVDAINDGIEARGIKYGCDPSFSKDCMSNEELAKFVYEREYVNPLCDGFYDEVSAKTRLVGFGFLGLAVIFFGIMGIWIILAIAVMLEPEKKKK